MESNYISEIFSGDNSTTNSALEALIQQGMMLTVPPDIDLSSMTTILQTIVYGLMIPFAWSLAPGGFTPFIL
jgi:hypothetical protein